MSVLEFIFGILVLIFIFMSLVVYFAFKYDRLETDNKRQKEQNKRVRDFKKLNNKKEDK